MTIAVIDIDYVKYGAASVGEKRTVKAYHPVTGDSWIASNRFHTPPTLSLQHISQ